MSDWAGAVAALRGAGEDDIVSRIPTYMHPLAGRSLARHVVRALATLEPAPRRLAVLVREGVDAAILGAPPAAPIAVGSPEAWWRALSASLDDGIERVLVVDGAAPALSRSLAALVAGPIDRALRGERGELLALWAGRERLARLADGRTLEAVAEELEPVAAADPAEAFLVRDRAALARASILIRNRIVERHMAAGVTFILPETVLVDVDVVIGQDTVIYPGVVIEGETEIGAETVIGPACWIVDSRIGSGVELKGWNYIVRTAIRNRAVLEPYVRRGFD